VDVPAWVDELNPDREINGMTAAVAAKLVKDLCGLACGGRKYSTLVLSGGRRPQAAVEGRVLRSRFQRPSTTRFALRSGRANPYRP